VLQSVSALPPSGARLFSSPQGQSRFQRINSSISCSWRRWQKCWRLFFRTLADFGGVSRVVAGIMSSCRDFFTTSAIQCACHTMIQDYLDEELGSTSSGSRFESIRGTTSHYFAPIRIGATKCAAPERSSPS
jgi:hypothetical protein